MRNMLRTILALALALCMLSVPMLASAEPTLEGVHDQSDGRNGV